MGTKLSHTLLDLGFFSALGTLEYSGSRAQATTVLRGTPLCWDANNGVIAFYDEEGRPWIKRNDGVYETGEMTRKLAADHNVRRGCHVPHSNDGGLFRELLMTL